MTQYIDKDALVTEIESLLDKGKYHEVYDFAYRDGNNVALYVLKNKLDTLEVKEVDLEKEQMMKNATEVTVHIDAGGYPYTPEIELYDYDKDVPLAKEGDKYKVVLIKED